MRIFLLLIIALPAMAEEKYYATALGGLAALSGDGKTDFSGEMPQASLYDPKNGAALNLGAGVHLNDWVAIQGNYIWNHNDVTLAEIQGQTFQERQRGVRQNAVDVDGLLYFRPRRSKLRPYLSVGLGAVHIRVADVSSNWRPGLRVAVGIDLLTNNRWGFRYSFSEMLTGNAINELLNPPGKRKLMNFQNLFGFVKYF